MKNKDERMEDWMREEFQKTSSGDEHYLAFTELFRAVFNGEKGDALDCPDRLVEENDPDLGTVREYIEARSPELFRQYLKCLNDGHSAEFAHIFALKYHEQYDDVERASIEAFAVFRASNRAYEEAQTVCIHQGRSTLYAEKCAGYLTDSDIGFSDAQAKAQRYEREFNDCIAKGFPEIRAKAFAEYMCNPENSDDRSFAEAYARVYEEQVAAGVSHTNAHYYADTFVNYYQLFGGDWDESEADGDVDRARILTMGDLRARGKGFDRNDYAKVFESHYERVPERSGQSEAERLAEIEMRTDVAMKERALRRAHRDDKECPRGTVYLDLETRRTADEVGGWDKLSELGVSVAVAITSAGPRVYTEETIQKLSDILARADRIVGYNLHNFDLKVLSGYAGFSIGNAQIVDLLDEVERTARYRVPLRLLASTTLSIDLHHDSLDMVNFWKSGRILDVIEGCGKDVFAIKALHEHACEKGALFPVPVSHGPCGQIG